MWNDFWLSVNRWHSPYTYTTDADGVEWRHNKSDTFWKPVKSYDPSFVQGTVPTPQFTVFGKSFDTLHAIALGLLLIIVLLLGSMI